ncbi:pyruvate carboxyltransferase [Micromonospora sp. NPDC023633]|uniref:LeuA family protein n=1 Tax=Micromonospora sp. NPDC023633 TaxID=3154320 RepID=UPI0033E1A1AF
MTDSTGRTPRRISIFDTTLRDGEQAPRNAMSPQTKLDLALRIEALGVDAVEAGFPASSAKDVEATRLISAALTTARVATLCRAARGDVETAVEAAGTRNHQLQVIATASEIHLEHKRGITRDTALRELHDAISLASSLGVPFITLAMEDSSRGSIDLLRATVETALEAGATQIGVGDTMGCSTPGEFGELVATVREWTPASASLTVHCHNDFGLALANTMAAIEAGADEVQVTLGGVGERAGNTALEEVVGLLAYKSDVYGATTDVKTEGMYEVYSAIRAAIGLEEPRNKALFGTYAFATVAGMHQQGMLQNPLTYEYVEPGRFGRESQLLVARHSGRAVLRHVAAQAQLDLSEDTVDRLYEKLVNGRADGDCVQLSVLREEIVAEMASVAESAR